MEPIVEFFSGLLDTNLWPARWYCGVWSSFHGWLYILSELLIWLAYFIIPIILIWFASKKPNLPYSPLFWLFGLFITMCGITHLMDAIIFWWPAYRLSALLRFATAIVSMATVFVLLKELPRFASLLFSDTASGSQELQEEKDILLQKIADRDLEIKDLKKQLKN